MANHAIASSSFIAPNEGGSTAPAAVEGSVSAGPSTAVGSNEAAARGQANRPSTPIVRPYKCAECGQAYARSEHLDRHARTHQPDAKYPCDKCSKKFARSDVLKRHKKLHDRDHKAIINAAGPGSLSARKQAAFERSAKACVACAASKVKCTGETTCQRCVTLGRQCIYDSTEGRRTSVKRARLSGSESIQRSESPDDDDLDEEEDDDELEQNSGSNGHSTFEDLLAITGNTSLEQIATEYSGNMNSNYRAPSRDSKGGPALKGHAAGPSNPNASSVSGMFSGPNNVLNFPNPTVRSNIGASSSSLTATYLPGQALGSSYPPASFQPSNAATMTAAFPAHTSANFFPSSMIGDFTGASLNLESNAMSTEFFDGLFALSPRTQEGLNANLELATDNSCFWNSFFSPTASNTFTPGAISHVCLDLPDPPPKTEYLGGTADKVHSNAVGEATTPSDAARESEVGSTHTNHSSKARIIISANGVATRHHSPEPGQDPAPSRTWIEWNPTEEDSALKSIDEPMDISPTHTKGLALDEFSFIPAFDEPVRLSVLETLRFSQLTDREYHAIYRTLSRIPLATYDLVLKIFFHRWHRHLPFLHLPSFHPRKTVGFLLNAMIGIGLLYTPLPGALQLGRVMLELVKRGMEHLTNRDNRLARSLPMVQAIMLWSTTKWVGSPRELELTEVLRGVYNTCLRRLCVFEEPFGAPYAGDTPEQRWASFIRQEERRRTVLESELTTILQASTSLTVSELKTCLPCAEELWNARTAEEWEALNLKTAPQLSIPSLFKLTALDGPFPISSSVKITPVGAHILVKALHMQLFHALQFRSMGMTALAESASSTVRRSLGRLGRGLNEFTPTFGIDGDPSRCIAATLGYHLAHVATYVRLDLLEMVAGRETATSNNNQRKNELITWMSSHVEEARTMALHAGQMVRLVRQYSTQSPPEFGLFYAALALHLFAHSDACKPTSPTMASQSMPYQLDLYQSPDKDPSTWIAAGGACGLDGIPDLAARDAPREVLSKLGDALFRAGAVWRYGQVLAVVLKDLGERERGSGRTPMTDL